MLHEHFSRTDGRKGEREEEEGRERARDKKLQSANSQPSATPYQSALGVGSTEVQTGRGQTHSAALVAHVSSHELTLLCSSPLFPKYPFLLHLLIASASLFQLEHPPTSQTTFPTGAPAFPPPTTLLFQYAEVGKRLRQQMQPTRLMPSAKRRPLPSASLSCFSPSTDMDCPGDDMRKLVCCSVQMN